MSESDQALVNDEALDGGEPVLVVGRAVVAAGDRGDGFCRDDRVSSLLLPIYGLRQMAWFLRASRKYDVNNIERGSAT
jgi:hypothetical protein